MSTERHDEDRAAVVERFARRLEATGHPRISGRVLGHVLTAAEPALSLTRLAEELGVSKASVSTNARLLMAKHLLVVVPVEGSREVHYAAVPDGTAQAFAEAAAAALAMSQLADDALRLCSGTITPGVVALRSMREGYARVHALFSREGALARETSR